MAEKYIFIKGARVHNLQNIDIDIPRDKLVVITGVSGSGKSSLAFDTLYAEGQRRYIESLSAYARQFLEQMEKPDVEYIEGLPPTISIEQRSGVGTPRSTVATTTEIYDYFRVLFARVGRVHCYKCGKEISQQTAQQMVDQVLALPVGMRLMVLAPLVRGRKGEHREVFARIKRDGFIRARVDGRIIEMGAGKPRFHLAKNKKHEIAAVVDRLVIEQGIKNRLTESVETALKLGEGLVVVAQENKHRWIETIYNEHFACIDCGISFAELSPRVFSFNSPYGACPTCNGLGTKMELDIDLIIPDKSLSLSGGAVEAWRKSGHRMAIYYYHFLRDFASHFEVDLDLPYAKLDEEKKRLLLYGTKPEDEPKYGHSFEGLIPNLEYRFRNTTSDYVKQRILGYMSEQPCPTCNGARLKKESLSVRVGGKNIYEISQMDIASAERFFNGLTLRSEETKIAVQVLKEIKGRLTFLIDVGLGYLTLDRKSTTLAGGEAQRIRLASQVGSGLVGVCYVLDEPTIGLHSRDNQRLLDTLKRLRDLGNTVVVVEHDEDTIRTADYLIDIGPGAGVNGGRIVTHGALNETLQNKYSVTVKYLTGDLKIPVPKQRRPVIPDKIIKVLGAREHNLKNIDVAVPTGCFCCVTGVSGSGKSTLVNEIIYKALRRKLAKSPERPGAHSKIVGIEETLDKVIIIDQSPIGRTPRSNPATYTGVFDEVRYFFAQIKESRIRGYRPSRFSFNLKGGRCELCQGQGTKVIEMHFLPEVHVVCEACKGKRYNRETLEIKYKDRNIADILDMNVSAALELFQPFPKIVRILKTLDEVGLGYIALGQSSTTLSGGEAQRVKLAAQLIATASGHLPNKHTLYILDEPTTGLHYADISKLLEVLNRLVNLGNTVLVIEHNMHVVKTADYIIDLGPEGGDKGGGIIATGTPEEIARVERSYTGQILRYYLN